MYGVETKWSIYVQPPFSLLTGYIYQSRMDIHVYILSLPIDMKDRTIMGLIILDLIIILVGYKIHGIRSPEEYGL